MIKVYIVDDHAVVVEGITAMLQMEKEIEVVGHSEKAGHCINFFLSHTADVILMDISLPDMNGVDLCKEIKTKYPGIMVLALSTFNQGTYIRKMMDNGASGYLLKNTGRKEIVEAIKTVTSGKIYLSNDAVQALKTDTQLQHNIPQLTKREKEVLQNIATGLTNLQIAEKLFISVDTVDTHRKNLHTKLKVKNSASLILAAINLKII